MDIGSVATVLTSLKTAADMAKVVKDINDETKRQSAVIDLQSAIMNAQSNAITAQVEQHALLKQISQLEAKIAEFDSWNSEIDRYKLVDFGGGTFAFELKEEAAKGEPSHKLCANCVPKKLKSILQFQHRTSLGQGLFKCHGCGSDVFLGVRKEDSYRRVSAGDSWHGDF
jgi:hypothetical protein